MDEHGRPFTHDTFPDHTSELFLRVREALQARLRSEPRRHIDLDTIAGQQVLQDLAARVVAVAREVYGDGHSD